MTDCFIVLYNVCNSCNHGNKSLVPGLAVPCMLAKITDHKKVETNQSPKIPSSACREWPFSGR